MLHLHLVQGVFAQDKMMDKKMNHKMSMKKDCVMMKDGKMIVMKGGNTMAMDQDITMENGTMVKVIAYTQTKQNLKILGADDVDL